MKNLTVREIAQICHEANRALQALQKDTGIPVAPPWDDFEGQDGVIDGVVKAIEGMTPEQLHENWCNYRRNEGWKYGDVKDVDLKTHPCLLDYSQLPADQKLKDQLFSAIIHALKPQQSRQGAFEQGRHEGRG